MKKLLLAVLAALFPALAEAACSTSVPTGSITIVDCTAENLVTNSPSYALTDATALALDFYLGWNNAATALLDGTPVAGQLSFANGNPVITWAGLSSGTPTAHHMAVNSYVVLTTTYAGNANPLSLPSNFTASTFTAQTVYYVVAPVTTNGFSLSATPGGAAITPNASGTAYAFDLVPAFAAASNAAINSWVQGQKTAATAQPTIPSGLPITPNQ